MESRKDEKEVEEEGKKSEQIRSNCMEVKVKEIRWREIKDPIKVSWQF